MGNHNIIALKFREKLAKLLNHFVTDNNAKTVIDLTKIIDIHKHNGNDGILLFCFSHKIGKQSHKIVTVVQSCEHIIISHISQLIILILEFGHIFKADNFIRRKIPFIINNGNFAFHPGLSVFQFNDAAV